MEEKQVISQCSFCGQQKPDNEDYITSKKNVTVFICFSCVAQAWGLISARQPEPKKDDTAK